MNRAVQHLLMSLWAAEREGDVRDARLHGQSPLANGAREDVCHEAEQDGLVVRAGAGWRLTAAGEPVGRGLLRRHRLAERLLSDLLELPEEEFEQSACRFEHHLTESVTERICALLGHPTTCPHGHMIPPGHCCKARTRHVEPIVERLSDIPANTLTRVVFVTPQVNGNLDRLRALGLSPGSTVILRQKIPCCVMQVGETEIATDESVGREIFVARVEAARDQ